MALKDAYYGIEDKYYAFIDLLDKKGLSLYPVIDAIESKNIPSFPVFALVAALIVIGLAWLAAGIVLPGAGLSVLVTDAEDNSALAGAEVVVSFAGQTATGMTNDEGKVGFGLPAGSDVTVTVTKSGYEEKSVTFNIGESPERAVSLARAVEMLSKTIQLMNGSTNELLQDTVSISFSCSNPESDFSETKTTSNGEVLLNVPANCGNLIANPISGFTVEDSVIDLDDASPQLFLQEQETDEGSVAVQVKDEDGDSVAGATVRLLRSDGIEEGLEYSSTSGAAVFDDVPVGSYYVVVHDRQGRYADYDSSLVEGSKSLYKDATLEFDVEMQETVAGTIKVRVLDALSRSAVANAEVKLKKNSTVMDVQYTDSDGEIVFNVQENTSYDIEVNDPGYLIATVSNVSTGTSFNEVLLEPATSGNSQALIVEARDSRGNPIDGVKLVLKKSDGTTVGSSKVTGFDGMAEFAGLALETYYVYAVKKGFEGKNSDPITIKARQENKLVITLTIGFGDVAAKVLDDKGEAVQGAIAELYDIATGEKEGDKLTDDEGIASFNARADKKVFFVIEADGYMTHHTIAVSPQPGATTELEVKLVKDVTSLEVELVGLFLLEEETFGNAINPGELYTAKLLLKVPSRTSFNKAGVHLRTGKSEEDRVNITEEDDLYIREVRASTSEMIKGTSYYPSTGYAEDSKHLTTGDGKWVNVEWTNVSAGVYELEADIQVRDTTALGSALQVFYRGWGKSGSYVRYPVDNELGSQEATANKQALYANAKLETYTAGPTTLCDESFCKSFIIEDMQNRTKTSVSAEFPATIENTYRLHFSINSVGTKPLPNSEIGFGSESDGLKFTNYLITDALGTASTGIANAYEVTKPAGTITKGSVVSGYVEFETEKEGSNFLTVVIKSEQTPELEESIDIRVEAAEALEIDLLPKEIVPMIDNLILVRVSVNDIGISNSAVSMELDGENIFSSQTNADGEASYELEAPRPGQTLVITAQKNGYRDAEVEIAIDESIILVTPPEISERLNRAAFEKDIGLLLTNLTASRLELSDVAVTDDFKGLVEFRFREDYTGRKLEIGTDANMFVQAKLTEKGFELEEARTLKGNISLYAKAEGVERTFVTNVPLEIRINLGDGVDDAGCLKVSPAQWKIITSSTTNKVLELEMENACEISGTEIPLTNLRVKLDLKEDNSVGEFELSSEDLEGAATVVLEDGFKAIVPQLPAGFEGTLRIEFRPDNGVDSAEAAYDIEFKADNITESGTEEIEANVETEVHLSKLSECVKVIAPEPMVIETSPFNTGYSIYNQYGMNSRTGWQTGFSGSGYYGGQSGIGGQGYSGGYSGRGGMWPNAGLAMPFNSRTYDTTRDSLWKYDLGSNAFRVENTCTIPIEVDIEASSQLKTSENQFVLEPQEAQSVKVESSYKLGKYGVDVRARTKGSKDKFALIESLEVIVKSPDEVSDCFKIVPSTIKFNDVFGREESAQIYNYCYDSGVSLEETNNVVQFTCRIPGSPTDVLNIDPKTWESQNQQQQRQPTQGQYGNQYYNQQSGYRGTAYPAGYGSSQYVSEGSCALVGDIYIRSEEKIETAGATTQIIKLDVRPNIHYRQQVCHLMAQYPGQTVYGLRLTVSNLFNRVQTPATVRINYRSAYGGQGTAYEQVTLEDLWGGAETLDQCLAKAGVGGGMFGTQECIAKLPSRGNPDPNTSVSELVNRDALDITKNFTANNGYIPSSEFTGNTYQWEPTKDVLNIDLTRSRGASGEDFIENITPATYTDKKSKVVLKFEPLSKCRKDWSIKVTIDRSQMTKKCAEISTSVSFDIRRPSIRSNPIRANIPVKVKVLHPTQDEYESGCTGVDAAAPVSDFQKAKAEIDALKKKGETIDDKKLIEIAKGKKLTDAQKKTLEEYAKDALEPEPAEVKDCPDGLGYTGKNAFTKYGFDKLLFDWSPTLPKDTCDEDGDEMFCDMLQFSVGLVKKGSKIKTDLDGWKNGKLVNSEYLKMALDISSTKGYAKSSEIWRWAKAQVATVDGGVFFLKGENELLASEKLPINSKGLLEKLAEIQKLDEKENAHDIISKTNAVLNEFKPEDVPRTLIVLPESYSSDIGSLVGIDAPKRADSGVKFTNKIIPLKKYREFHREMLAAINGQRSSYECYAGNEKITEKNAAEKRKEISKCTKEGKDVTIAKLQALKTSIANGGGFVIAAMHSKNMKDSVSYILENAANANNIKANLKEWYNENVKFSSYLVMEDYGKDKRDGFVKYENPDYKSMEEIKELGYPEWTISGKGQEDNKLGHSGLYPIVLDYKWGDNKFELEIGEVKELDKIGENKEYQLNQLLKVVYRNIGSTKILLAKDTCTNRVLNKLKEVEFEEGNLFVDTRGGDILFVSENKFAYNPSTAITLEADIKMGEEEEILLYELLNNKDKEINDERSHAINKLFSWKNNREFDDERLNARNCPFWDAKLDPTTDIGFVEEFGNRGTENLKGLIFLPSQSRYTLRIYCASGDTSLRTSTDNSQPVDNLQVTKGYLIKQSGRVIALNYKSQPTQATALNSYINKIKEGQVCVSATDSDMTLAWNPDAFLN